MWQTSKEKCPICGNNLQELLDYMDFTLMEDHKKCENCKQYFYSYVTGGFQVLIGDKEFSWSYTTTKEEVNLINDNIIKEIENIKQLVKND